MKNKPVLLMMVFSGFMLFFCLSFPLFAHELINQQDVPVPHQRGLSDDLRAQRSTYFVNGKLVLELIVKTKKSSAEGESSPWFSMRVNTLGFNPVQTIDFLSLLTKKIREKSGRQIGFTPYSLIKQEEDNQGKEDSFPKEYDIILFSSRKDFISQEEAKTIVGVTTDVMQETVYWVSQPTTLPPSK